MTPPQRIYLASRSPRRRELLQQIGVPFDTLLFWQARVKLNEKGEAEVSVPLNDSITSFRIVAVGQAATGFFGTGHSSIRTTQDLILASGLPRVVREGANCVRLPLLKRWLPAAVFDAKMTKMFGLDKLP